MMPSDFNAEMLIACCKNIGFDITCGACAEQFFCGSSSVEHEVRCTTERHAKKWQEYERDYILPCFKWAKELGYDLEKAVSDHPGKNCVELLVMWLRAERCLHGKGP